MMTLAGLGAELWASFVLVRSLTKFLYGVSSHDSISFIIVPLVLVAVSTLACIVPARRAARVDPLQVRRAG